MGYFDRFIVFLGKYSYVLIYGLRNITINMLLIYTLFENKKMTSVEQLRRINRYVCLMVFYHSVICEKYRI